MASKGPQVVAVTSGMSTGEYRDILDNLGVFKRALQADETATETLTTKFKAAKWIDTNAKDVGPKEILAKTLDMVENSTKYYYAFKEMVQDTTGLQHILPNFKAENVPTNPTFKIGGPDILEENVSAHAGATGITPEEFFDGDYSKDDEVKSKFPFDERNANLFLSPSVLALLNKQRSHIDSLIEEKRVLMHEVEQLKKRLTQATENRKTSEEAVNIEIDECRKKLFEVEKEKKQMEQDHQEQIRNLKSNIAQLESDRESAKKDMKVEICDLKSQLSEAKEKLAQKEIQILRQQKKILELETEKTLKAKEEEHKKSLEAKDVQIRRLMEKLSLHKETSL